MKKITKILLKAGCKASLGIGIAVCVTQIKKDRDEIKQLKAKNKELCDCVEMQNGVIRDFQKLMGHEVDTE